MATPVKIKCNVSSIDGYSDSLFTIRLKPEKRLPRFKPGQFLHFALDPFDPAGGYWPESRVFSIASTSLDSEIVIAYSVKGIFTQRMKNELEVGKEVWIKLPYGHFVISSESDGEVILVAGGTGITPFIPFLEESVKKSYEGKISLIYGVRQPEFFIFGGVIANAIANLKDFQLHTFSEEQGNTDSNFQFIEGKLTIDVILNATSNVKKSDYYLSGPVEMINTFKKDLMCAGVSNTKIHIDEWE